MLKAEAFLESIKEGITEILKKEYKDGIPKLDALIQEECKEKLEVLNSELSPVEKLGKLNIISSKYIFLRNEEIKQQKEEKEKSKNETFSESIFKKFSNKRNLEL